MRCRERDAICPTEERSAITAGPIFEWKIGHNINFRHVLQIRSSAKCNRTAKQNMLVRILQFPDLNGEY